MLNKEMESLLRMWTERMRLGDAETADIRKRIVTSFQSPDEVRWWQACFRSGLEALGEGLVQSPWFSRPWNQQSV